MNESWTSQSSDVRPHLARQSWPTLIVNSFHLSERDRHRMNGESRREAPNKFGIGGPGDAHNDQVQLSTIYSAFPGRFEGQTITWLWHQNRSCWKQLNMRIKELIVPHRPHHPSNKLLLIMSSSLRCVHRINRISYCICVALMKVEFWESKQ